MAIFGIVTEFSTSVNTLMLETNKRLQQANMVKNPFKGFVKGFIITGEDGKVYFLNVISMLPLYPNVTLFGWLIAIGTYVIFGWNWLGTIPGVIIGSLGIFWSKYFYFFMMWLSLRKNKYKGRINLLKTELILEKVLQYGTE